VPLTLELGGKSPVILGASADLQKAANRIMAGKTLNAGQICLAPDYAMVPEGKERDFIGAATKAVNTMYPTGLKDNDEYTSIINQRHFDRIRGYVEEARAKGFLGKKIFGKDFDLDIIVHRGAGAYICGEETGLLESLEGKKGFPRLKPPFPAVVGLFNCPTVINNVETLSYLPYILNRGAEWFAKLGSEKNGGMRLLAVSGHVKKPGVYELPLGISLREVIYDYAGGIRNDNKLKAVVPGGLSAAILSADEIDVGLDFDQLKAKGTMAGSGGVIVLDDTTCMVNALLVTMRFYAHESCGQCSPCREGTGWVYKILERIYTGGGKQGDIENLADICNFMGGTTICALADGAAMPLRSYPQKFRSEFEHHIKYGKCDITQMSTDEINTDKHRLAFSGNKKDA
jgi:NADH-quinone oxidoreductase subunit F